MKLLSLFLSVCLISSLFSESVNASQCGRLLQEAGVVNTLKLNESFSNTVNAGDLLVSVFDAIYKAPNNSRIKIFSHSLKYDGIGSLMLLTSVAESRSQRGLKFDFFVDQSIESSRHYDLLAERSSNTIRYRSEPISREAERITTVVIESKDKTQVIRFDGELSSMDLKDASRKRPLQVKYMGRNFLRASPFKEDVLTKVLVSEAERDIVNKSIKENEQEYDVVYKSQIEKMTEADVLTMSAKAFDLALQLYIHKYGKSPSSDMSSLQILEQVLRK